MEFVLESENTGKRWSFPLKLNSRDEFERWVKTQNFQVPIGDRMYSANHYEDFVADMEEYGVLDVGGYDDELYHSYEITEENFPVVLEKFREYFKGHGLAE